jgi:CIC family chloride channel protein
MALAEPRKNRIWRLLDAPSHLRALVRRDEIGLIGLGLVAGAMAGVFVAFILGLTRYLHLWLFDVPLDGDLSNLPALGSPAQALVPFIGGLLLGGSWLFVHKWRPRRPADPIEANALHGGRMSLLDSALITAQTVVSNGFGASVGLEAAYTQMGSGFASWLGALFALRRTDMRMLVACGSAGAIGAAFGAPLTGAFYAFELILGSYTPFGLGPIGAAAVSGVMVSRLFGTTGEFMGELTAPLQLSLADLASLLALATICAAAGIAIMRAVSLVETVFRWTHLPYALHPAAGGLIVGGLALVTPQVLGSGHGALVGIFLGSVPLTATVALAIVGLKACASAISIGSGFRGGLFFASLFLGVLIGEAYAMAMHALDPALAPPAAICAVTGMTALAVAIVGGPMTMTFLSLEITGDFRLGLAMLAVSILVSFILRRSFGYSFTTWRLHLRGETIHSAQDVGWMRDLTVSRLMRTDAPKALASMSLANFRQDFPLGTSPWAVAVDAAGRYRGMVFGPDVHLANADGTADDTTIAQFIRSPDIFLLPHMNIKAAAQIFEKHECEALAVVDSEAGRHAIGLLSEAHVLRRYAAELDNARRALSDEIWIGRS